MRLAGLRHWLGGIGRSVPQAGQVVPRAAAVGHADAPPASPPPRWTPLRLEIAESLWGEGNHLPGISAEILRLAAPFGLSAASSVLLAGAGSGGPALRLASEFGAWVSGLETDPVLLAAAGQLVRHAGAALGKRTTVQRWTPATPALRPAAYHHAIAIEALQCAEPPAAVRAVGQALRPGGQLAVLELVAASAADSASPAVRALCRLEQRPPLPCGAAWLTGPLEQLGFEIRVTEDISARHIRHAVDGWKRLVRELGGERPPPLRAAALVAEAEVWLRRIALLRSGQIRLMRWHAIAPATAVPGGAA